MILKKNYTRYMGVCGTETSISMLTNTGEEYDSQKEALNK